MISREEAIERLERMLDETQVVCNSHTATEPIRSALKKDAETYRMAIKTLSQPPADQWIPCSERLPEERQKVLVTLETFTGVRFVRMDWIKDGNWWLWNSDNVTAWMPLPEPYKGVE